MFSCLPYLKYRCLLWENNYDSPLSQLIRLQNRAVRIIEDVTLQDSLTPHYVNLDLLKFHDIVKLYTCLLVYERVSESKPCNFSITLVSEQHNYSTRSASRQLIQHILVTMSRNVNKTSKESQPKRALTE